MSAALEIRIDSEELRQLQARLERLAGALGDTRPVLEAIGAKVASQTQRRIAQEKESPDGAPWPEWSDAYAGTRHAGHSLLRSEGDLLESIQHAVDGDVAEIGSNLVYAAAQQFGLEERGLPAREYLGVSAANLSELDDVLAEWADGLVTEALA